MPGEYRRKICDVQLTDLKSERREHYGREREVKDRCCIKDGDQKQGTALQFLWKQDCSRPIRFPHREEKNETRVLRRLIRVVSCGNAKFLSQETLCPQ
jgi:hypothetical protein